MSQPTELTALIERLSELSEKAIRVIDHRIFIYENKGDFSRYDNDMFFYDMVRDRNNLDDGFIQLIADFKALDNGGEYESE